MHVDGHGSISGNRGRWASLAGNLGCRLWRRSVPRDPATPAFASRVQCTKLGRQAAGWAARTVLPCLEHWNTGMRRLTLRPSYRYLPYIILTTVLAGPAFGQIGSFAIRSDQKSTGNDAELCIAV